MNLHQTIWLDFDYMSKHYEGEAIPALVISNNAPAPAFDIYFNNEYNGTIVKDSKNWGAASYIEQGLLHIISNKLSPYLTLQD